jgi:hypothetical protein
MPETVVSRGVEWEYQPDQACWTNDAGQVSPIRPELDYEVSFPEWPDSGVQRVQAPNAEVAAAEAVRLWEHDSLCYHVAEGDSAIVKVGELYFQVTGEMVPTYKAQITERPPDLLEEEVESDGQDKLGMCCHCGGSFPKSQTTIFRLGLELCADCAKDHDGE